MRSILVVLTLIVALASVVFAVADNRQELPWARALASFESAAAPPLLHTTNNAPALIPAAPASIITASVPPNTFVIASQVASADPVGPATSSGNTLVALQTNTFANPQGGPIAVAPAPAPASVPPSSVPGPWPDTPNASPQGTLGAAKVVAPVSPGVATQCAADPACIAQQAVRPLPANEANMIAQWPSSGPAMPPTTGPIRPETVAGVDRAEANTAASSWAAPSWPNPPPSNAPWPVPPVANQAAPSPAPDWASTPSTPPVDSLTSYQRAAAERLAAELAAWGPPAAPQIDPRRFTEAHWQGLEVIPKTPLVAQALNLPPTPGVIVDDVTLPADLQGFMAGDLVIAVNHVPTPDLASFIAATEVVRDQPRAHVQLIRDGQAQTLVLSALRTRVGTANGETPSMIPPGARMPHPYRGPCTNCHRIGTTGTLAVDQGDLITTAAPTIRVGDRRPHRDRGPCNACHRILP
jgi:hypothetical protein